MHWKSAHEVCHFQKKNTNVLYSPNIIKFQAQFEHYFSVGKDKEAGEDTSHWELSMRGIYCDWVLVVQKSLLTPWFQGHC